MTERCDFGDLEAQVYKDIWLVSLRNSAGASGIMMAWLVEWVGLCLAQVIAQLNKYYTGFNGQFRSGFFPVQQSFFSVYRYEAPVLGTTLKRRNILKKFLMKKMQFRRKKKRHEATSYAVNGAPHTWAKIYMFWAQNTDETVTRL